ncbi:hypothetical protein SELMODRAFT_411397 [Selaginella moellendorffii]|uniref:Uncharacterized protein n=1 Tax=Selaginella moellendorffii TaxID=88036 RepID=D8RHI2_SELML|nr:hypothetical protein SELMODRAFT_411397 [Selaginella moellendorffii]
MGINRIMMEAIVCEKPTYYDTMKSLQQQQKQQQPQKMPLFSRRLIKYMRIEKVLARDGFLDGADLFGSAGSLEMQVLLVFDVRMLAHEWELVLRSFDKSKLLVRLLRMDMECSPDVEFDEGISQEDFDQETYDELVEDLEAAKMVAQNGGFNKIWTNTCVDLFNFQKQWIQRQLEDDFSLGEHPNKQEVKYKMTKRESTDTQTAFNGVEESQH